VLAYLELSIAYYTGKQELRKDKDFVGFYFITILEPKRFKIVSKFYTFRSKSRPEHPHDEDKAYQPP
jgi:hypothetical protein